MINPFKSLGDLKQMRDQAAKMQQALASETVELDENGVHIIMTGDQKILKFELQGQSNDLVRDKLNKAIKMSQEIAAKKLTEMSGGLQGLLGQ